MQVEENREPKGPDEVVADTAALAANSAERAQEAAAATLVHAQEAVAGVAQVAAEETRQSEERLAQWQSEIASQHATLRDELSRTNQETQAKLAEAMDAILSIQTRLDKPPESPPSPSPEPKGETPPEGERPPPEPPSPQKRRAHRWI